MTDMIRRLPYEQGEAAGQLAAGGALQAGAAASQQPALRWYRITPAALLLGSSQRPHEVDQAACRALGARLYRRGSGGGLVLADETLLLLDLALPDSHPLYLSDVTESYRWLGAAWATALQALGAEPQLLAVADARSDTQQLDPLLRRICFGGRSPYEVLCGGAKVVGLAQIRRRGAALFQAGVYLRWQPERTAELAWASAPERARTTELLGQRVVGLDRIIPKATEQAVRHAFEQALATYALSVQDDGWDEQEQLARQAAGKRYVPIEPPHAD